MKKIILLSWLIVSIAACRSHADTAQTTSDTLESWAFPHFEKADSLNPILLPSANQFFVEPITKDTLAWEVRNVLNPTAVVQGDTVYLLYRAQDATGTSRLGLATSTDGLHFTKMPEPVFYPASDTMQRYEWNYRKKPGQKINASECATCYFDGVEDPRVISTPDGDYLMTYTAYDGKTARLALATSTNLRQWTKQGLMLKESTYQNYWSKSGAIVCEQKGSSMVAKKIAGRFWMYFGDTKLFMASSEDLLHWTVAMNSESNAMIEVLHPRNGYFDSRLVEPGPYAWYKDSGILLIYNASNAANYNDSTLPRFTYAAGQALFDNSQPWKLMKRTNEPFIRPDKPYEKIGEVNEVCFVEGLVFFKGSWYLYYGTADSRIAVAVYTPKK
jgi:beta-1,2-mannosidase